MICYIQLIPISCLEIEAFFQVRARFTDGPITLHLVGIEKGLDASARDIFEEILQNPSQSRARQLDGGLGVDLQQLDLETISLT